MSERWSSNSRTCTAVPESLTTQNLVGLQLGNWTSYRFKCRSSVNSIAFISAIVLLRGNSLYQLELGKGDAAIMSMAFGESVTRDETLTDAGVHGAIGRAGLMREAGKVLLMKFSLKCFRGYSATIFSRSSAETDRSLFQAHRDPLPNRVERLRGACAE